MNKDYVDFNQASNYVIQWLQESGQARRKYQQLVYRMDLAMMGRPYRKLYREEMLSAVGRLPEEDLERVADKKCADVPEGSSLTLKTAISNRANQLASGVESYEYVINDTIGIIDDDTEEMLGAQCKQDYINNRLEQFAPVFSRDLDKYGMAVAYVSYDQKCGKNKVQRFHPKNSWWDTKYMSNGTERFRAVSMMYDWKKLKKLIEECKDEVNYELEVPDKSVLNKNGVLDKHIKVGNKKITTINDLDIYVQDMNKLATSPDLQAAITDYWEYDHDLRSCYNLSWYKSYATDAKALTNSGYGGNDVELTILYDLENKIEFKIINRRFIISANQSAFRRKIAFPIYNPNEDTNIIRVEDFELECPLQFQFENIENRDMVEHPISTAMLLLDAHDELCSWRAKYSHVCKILSILRIETNAADAESLKNVLNIMGVILDDIQGDINTVNFQYDYTPITSQIEYYENLIKESLHAYDQFDALQAMGDRASAAESGMANGAIAQGLATHQLTVMRMYADIARQCIKNRVAYSSNQEFPIYNAGNYSSVTIAQMALNAVINVKSKMAKKVQDRQNAASALTLLGTLRDVLTPNGTAELIVEAMHENIPRKMARTFIKESGPSQEEMQLAQLQAQNQAQQLQQNQQSYEQNPIPYEVNNVMNTMNPDEVDQVISGLSQPQTTEPQMQGDEMIDMPQQEGAMQTDLQGLTPETGSQFANPNSLGEM